MNIHEYQAKVLLAKFGVATPRGGVAFTPEEAEHMARELGGDEELAGTIVIGSTLISLATTIGWLFFLAHGG